MSPLLLRACVPSLVLAALVGASFVACSSEQSPMADASVVNATRPDAGPHELPCEVDALLVRRCHECHGGTRSDVPRLVTHDDLEKRIPTEPDRPLAEVALGKMTADRGYMPPSPRSRVPAEEVAAFRAWVESGRPRGRCGDLGGGTTDAATDARSTDASAD